jgi:hypothetical protein
LCHTIVYILFLCKFVVFSLPLFDPLAGPVTTDPEPPLSLLTGAPLEPAPDVPGSPLLEPELLPELPEDAGLASSPPPADMLERVLPSLGATIPPLPP